MSEANDTLAYHVGSASVNRLAWIDRDGTERESAYNRDQEWIFAPRLAPDGIRIALSTYRQNSLGEIWVLDPARRNEIRMTRDDDSGMAAWSRSGRELAIMTTSPGVAALKRAPSDRPDSGRVWKSIPGLATVDSWLTGDRGVLFTLIAAETGSDIWLLEDRPGAEPQSVMATSASEHSPEASPDGKWFAYVSDVTGREEVYVQSFGAGGSPWKVSSAGGNDPRWRADGRELFYVAAGGRLNAVPTTLGDTFVAGPAKLLFSVRMDETGNRQYDASPDGRRFLVNLTKAKIDSSIVVVIGWADEIRRRLAGGGGSP